MFKVETRGYYPAKRVIKEMEYHLKLMENENSQIKGVTVRPILESDNVVHNGGLTHVFIVEKETDDADFSDLLYDIRCAEHPHGTMLYYINKSGTRKLIGVPNCDYSQDYKTMDLVRKNLDNMEDETLGHDE